MKNWGTKKRWAFLLVLVAVAALAAFLLVDNNRTPQARQASLVSPGGFGGAFPGFARAEEPVPFRFPEDHGPHPDYQTEWWYYTGVLKGEAGRVFGYQLTFFRRAMLPPQELPHRDSDWSSGQVYMAHFALTDVQGGQFYAFERLARGAAGLAGAESSPFEVWLEDWQVISTAAGEYQMLASQGGIELDLTLRETIPPILQGDHGLSPKGPEPGNASYYYSLVQLQTEGTLRTPGNTYKVEGRSWMDHEFSTSALAEYQVGWDWFALQLDNGSALMVFQIRQEGGEVDPFSSGTWVQPNGETHHLEAEDFSILVEDTWTSPHSGAVYPSRWRVLVPSIDLELQVEPYLADQELNVSYSYWEGAVQTNGSIAGSRVQGDGYVELTGYSGSMGGEF